MDSSWLAGLPLPRDVGDTERRYAPMGLSGRGIELRARPGGGQTAVGYAAVFYRAGDPGTQFQIGTDAGRPVIERIIPGTFDDTIRRDDVVALFNHHPDNILGRLAARTLRLTTDGRGLRYEIDLPSSDIGERVGRMLARGELTGSSFGFAVRPDGGQRFIEARTEVIRELRAVTLRDVGPVTFPAYKGTTAGLSGGLAPARSTTPGGRLPAETDAQRRRRVAADLAALGLPTA